MSASEAKKVSIESYLSSRGIKMERRGGLTLCSSPFSSDSNPSFAIYPDNRFYDFSSGKYGDIIDLVKELDNVDFKGAVNNILGGNFSEVKKPKKMNRKKNRRFNLDNFLLKDRSKIERVRNYANSRGIERGFYSCKFYEFIDNKFVERIGMGFLHLNKNLSPCGVKIRKIVNDTPRFTARGKQMYYILSNVDYFNVEDEFYFLYIAESESSANSLFEFLDKNKIPCIVVSFGSVSSIPNELPDGFLSNSVAKFLIIDYDGDEELYKERVSNYNHLGLVSKKVILPKGEDINSFYSKNKMESIEKILLP